jgi:hypothetical protein
MKDGENNRGRSGSVDLARSSAACRAVANRKRRHQDRPVQLLSARIEDFMWQCPPPRPVSGAARRPRGATAGVVAEFLRLAADVDCLLGKSNCSAAVQGGPGNVFF